jgi:hypothetical protein
MAMGWYKRRWRSPVIAVDVLALVQANLSRNVWRLTIVVLAVTFLQLIVAAWPLLPIYWPAAEYAVMAPADPIQASVSQLDLPSE